MTLIRTEAYQAGKRAGLAAVKQQRKASMWADLTKDHKTGHYVYKDLSKVLAFVLGCALVLFAAYADYKAGRPVGEWGTVILLSYALGIGALKYKELQDNRKTTDENGNPLAVPGTAEPPAKPEIMPQADEPAQKA